MSDLLPPSRDAVLQKLRAIKAPLFASYPLTRMALFGSVARDEAGLESDVDVIVEVDGSIGIRFIELADRLEHGLGRKVDLLTFKGLRPWWRAHIEQELIDV